MTIPSPGSVKTRSSSATPDITSATSETCAGLDRPPEPAGGEGGERLGQPPAVRVAGVVELDRRAEGVAHGRRELEVELGHPGR